MPKYQGKGSTKASKEALDWSRHALKRCRSVGCSALVRVQDATRAARKAKRAERPGDGCRSASCCKGRFEWRRFEQQQRVYRVGLADGSWVEADEF